MNRKEAAAAMHQNKYNCCQAVVCAFEDVLDLDKESLFRIAEGFGNGMGGMQGTCGALSGAVMLAGLKNSDRNLENPGSKGATTKLSKEMANRFEEKSGATICRDLKGVDTGVVLCSCPDCISNAVEIAEEVLGF